jgi:DNA-binding NarL/FixJ family response regulator
MPETRFTLDKRPIRVVIVDDQVDVRSRLGAGLIAHQRLNLIGEAAGGEEALQLCGLVKPDVALVALDMTPMDGVATTNAIRQRWPHIHVLVLASQPGDERQQSALEAGAKACLFDGASIDEVAEAILEAYVGGLSPADASPKPAQSATQELEWAARVQAGILPDKTPILSGWDFAARLEPARETSGDFFDFIPLANDKWGFVIGDVTDKGLGAAVFMALTSSLIRTYTIRYPTLPALAISSINERILTDTRGSMYVTVFFGVLEPDIGRLRYVNAGHNPPLLLSRLKGKPVDRLGTTGMALGMEEGGVWQQKIARLAAGDLLLLYTDGITEAQDRRGAFFGEQRLLDVLRRNKERPAREILEAVLGGVDAFTGGASRQDDIAMVVMARRG